MTVLATMTAWRSHLLSTACQNTADPPCKREQSHALYTAVELTAGMVVLPSETPPGNTQVAESRGVSLARSLLAPASEQEFGATVWHGTSVKA